MLICVVRQLGPALLSVQLRQKLEQREQVRLRLPSLWLLYSMVSSERLGSRSLRERKELNLVLLDTTGALFPAFLPNLLSSTSHRHVFFF